MGAQDREGMDSEWPSLGLFTSAILTVAPTTCPPASPHPETDGVYWSMGAGDPKKDSINVCWVMGGHMYRVTEVLNSI